MWPSDTTRPGPGKPAVALMPLLAVNGMQNVATPIGSVGSGSPVAVIVGRKHSRCLVSAQAPPSIPMLFAVAVGVVQARQEALAVGLDHAVAAEVARAARAVALAAADVGARAVAVVGHRLVAVSALRTSPVPAGHGEFALHGIELSSEQMPHGQTSIGSLFASSLHGIVEARLEVPVV